MLNGVLNTASLRVIATYARMDDGSAPNYTGPLVDIFQVVGPVQSRTGKPVRQKHYYFDSKTHLLLEVDYLLKRSDGSTTGVRVQRSNWTSVNGQMVPGTVTRQEGGKTVFSFTASNATFSAATADGTFAAQ
jgi:23S rRNA G2069 N7-methylase RlmK/C1962 C5-methylase RlmI